MVDISCRQIYLVIDIKYSWSNLLYSSIDRAKRDWKQNRPQITIRVAPALLEAVYFNVGRQPRVKHRLGMVEETTDCLTVSITILLLILDFISMLEAICDPGHYLVRQS